MRLAILTLFALPLCAQQAVIWDDDCSSDIDCAFAAASVWKLADQGYIKVLAVMADSANVQSIAAQKIFATYYGYQNKVLFGANQTSNPATSYCSTNHCNTSTQPSLGSPWFGQLVAAYNAGDTRSNYTDCITLYRTVLAAQPNSSVKIAATGFGTCLAGLLASSADGISALTGAQLVQQKVSMLTACCGINPTGTEFNFASDAPNWSTIFSTWTSQNGYPAVWMIDQSAGGTPKMGPPHFMNPAINPVYYVESITGNLQRGTWDAICVLFAAWGFVNPKNSVTLFSDGGNGTQAVNSSTGVNTWGTGTASGHHYMTKVASDTVISQIFDGFNYGFGFNALPPFAGTGGYAQGNVSLRGGKLQ